MGPSRQHCLVWKCAYEAPLDGDTVSASLLLGPQNTLLGVDDLRTVLKREDRIFRSVLFAVPPGRMLPFPASVKTCGAVVSKAWGADTSGSGTKSTSRGRRTQFPQWGRAVLRVIRTTGDPQTAGTACDLDWK